MDPASSALLTDLYQFTMLRAYLDHEMTETAVFEFFCRTLPPNRRFLVAAGLAQAIDYLETLSFADRDLEWLAANTRLPADFLERLKDFRFTGDVDAVPEGTVVFADEPLLRVTAPLPEAQFVETRLINILHLQTLIASKAVRFVFAAKGRTLIDFGFRRAHGAEAGVLAARAAYIAGFAGTATVEAGRSFGIPIFGTMAHSFIEAHDDETLAFERFAATHRQGVVLLIDTYDTETAARKVVALAPRLAAQGIDIAAIRLDSGDLAVLARRVRAILDHGGLNAVRIFASGGLEETAVARLHRDNVPIDGFGIGTSLVTSHDAAALDCAYKLQEYAGRPRRKRSPGKATWPGRKRIWRSRDRAGRIAGDVIGLSAEIGEGEPLLIPVMRRGRRLAPLPDLEDIRRRAAQELHGLPESLSDLEPGPAAPPYPVVIAPALQRLAAEVDLAIDERSERLESGPPAGGDAD